MYVFHVVDFVSILFAIYRIQEDHPIMSFSVSDDGRHALLNVASQVRSIPMHLSFSCMVMVEPLVGAFSKKITLL